MLVQRPGQGKVIGNSAAPIVLHLTAIKCLPADCGRTSPAEILLLVRAQRRRNRGVPNRSQMWRQATSHGNKPTIASRGAKGFVTQGSDQRSQPACLGPRIGINKNE